MPEYLFHGGCHGCENKLSICPECRYMLPNWSLPDLNTQHKEELAEKERMIKLAIKKAKEL